MPAERSIISTLYLAAMLVLAVPLWTGCGSQAQAPSAAIPSTWVSIDQSQNSAEMIRWAFSGQNISGI
jgi:hypothetical protein